MIIEKIREVSDFYGEKSTKFNFKMIEERKKIWANLVQLHGESNALKVFNADSNIVGSKAWYEQNPTSYEAVNIEGFYHLQNAYIMGLIDEYTTVCLLYKHGMV